VTVNSVTESGAMTKSKFRNLSIKQNRSFLAPVIFLWIVLATVVFAATAEHVIIVSIDGGRPDVVLTSDTPNIHAIAEHGAYTWWAQTVNPSVTLVSHCSMLTGCQPQKHGVSWNSWKPDKGFVKSTTCFELAKNADMSTAMVVSKRKLEHIAKPGTVDKFVTIKGGAEAVAQAAGEYFAQQKPNLLFVHFSDPDGAGHAHHWGSKEQHAAVEKCDRGIGILRQAVKDAGCSTTTVFIVTADHGGHLKSHGSKDVRDMTIPWVCYGPGIVQTGQIEKSISTRDTAATGVYALGLKPDPLWDGKAVTNIFVFEAKK